MYPFRQQATSSSTTRRRGRALAAILVLFSLTVVGRLAQLQLFQGADWRATAAVVQERTIELPPRRGSILDRDGTLLAFDVKATAIAVDSFNMTKPETLVAILAEELGLSREAVSEFVYRPSYFTWVDRRVDADVAARIEAKAAEADARGLILLDTWKRCYPQGRLASNVIGFVGLDGIGLEGIELQFDEDLRGSPECVHVVEGADGRTYQAEVVEPGVPGTDVVLTLDAELQFICEDEIEAGVSQFRASSGMVIALDPSTGEVLAMAQDKGFDLNRFSTSTLAERKNEAVSTLFEPGSIFKVFTGLAALDAGLVTIDDTFDGNDGIEISGHVMHNAESDPYGDVTFAEIIEHSINTGMIRVALLLGEERLYDTFRRLAFGEATGIELPGEEDGILRPAEVWTTLDLAAAAIGQSVAVTGIQLARGVSAVANGGWLPDVRITDPGAPTNVGEPVAGAAAIETMRSLMERVVETGTGTLAAVDGFDVAGKTGTAQKATPGRGYVDEKYTSLFAGFLPADDPQIVILVVLDEVKTTPVWGGYTAGQIFRDTVTRMIHAERFAPADSETFEAVGGLPATAQEPTKTTAEMLFGRH